jgi:NAD(P)-dependent dehydrogenase (short-subunit alcohol dehydrogenase family)
MEPSDHLFRRESARIITARAAARPMIKQRSGVIIFVTGSPARAHVPGATAIGVAFGAIGNLTQNLTFEISPFGVRVVCLRTLANTDSRSIQDTMDFLADKLNVTKDQAMAQIAQSNFLKVPATVQDTANAAVLIASDRMLTGTVVNARREPCWIKPPSVGIRQLSEINTGEREKLHGFNLSIVASDLLTKGDGRPWKLV